jgi:alanyl-tRNA synthetase
LGSSREKLIESFQKTMNEAEEARKKLKTSVKKLAPVIAKDVIKNAKQLGKIKLFSVYEEELDEEYHIAVGEQAIDREPSLIYCALIAKGQGIRVIVFVGEEARNSGMKASEIARGVASILGGSGGGDDRFGQGGGKSVERIKDALIIVEELVRK